MISEQLFKQLRLEFNMYSVYWRYWEGEPEFLGSSDNLEDAKAVALGYSDVDIQFEYQYSGLWTSDHKNGRFFIWKS